MTGFRWSSLAVLLLMICIGLSAPLLMGGREALVHVARLPLLDGLGLCAVMFCAWTLNMLRLRILLGVQHAELHYGKELGYGKMLRVYLAIEFVAKSTPLGTGAPVAAMALLAPYGVRPARCVVAYGVSACMDAIAVALLMGCFLLSGFAAAWGVNLGVALLLLAFVVALLGLGIYMALYRHKQLFRMLTVFPGFSAMAPGVGRFTRRHLVSAHRSLRQMAALPRRRLLLAGVLCLSYWLLYLSTLYLCIRVLGGGVTWLQSGFIQTVAMGVGHLFLLPGGAGGVEVSGMLLLKPLLGAAVAASAILIWRFSMLYLCLVLGVMAFLSLLRADSAARP